MRSPRSPSDSDPLAATRRPSAASPVASPDRLTLYRLLASVPALATYRAKLYAVVLAGTLAPAFVLLLVLVLGAGRLSLVAVLVLVVASAVTSIALVLWGIDRLLAPLDATTRAIDDVALERPLARTDLPGNDVAAQALRGVHALVTRIEEQAAAARRSGERDELTGLVNRRIARERAQEIVDRECRRGRAVRVVLADVDAFGAFNAAHGTGHGDALLKAIASRLARIAGEDGLAARWSGDAFLLVEAAAPGDFADARERLGRPIVVKGSADPVTLSLGIAETDERLPIDTLVSRAEASLAAARPPAGTR
jgi:diguanylate cyclase (GGDEF)-like protein